MLAKHIFKQGILLRNAGVLSRAAYHGGQHHEPSTMNDLPVPAGDWQEQYTRQNTKYNAILAIGVILLTGTISLVKSTGVVHFNFKPPQSLD